MKIAIIGAGIAGLTIAYRLTKLGHEVEVFEKGSVPGGLASGFKDDAWDWSLERHYHHIFTSDRAIASLAKEIECPIQYQNPKTSIWYGNEINRMDGPMELLRYPHLGIISKLRTAGSLAFLKLWPYWKVLESSAAEEWIKKYMGDESWEKIWEPLMNGKFGKFASKISAVWFWARIHARTKSLGYFEGGFSSLADKLVEKLADKSVNVKFDQEISRLEATNKKIKITVGKKSMTYDKVIVAAPSHAFLNLAPKLPDEYVGKIENLQGIGAVTLVLAIKEQFLEDGTYWLNINQKAPFLAVVEHTNMIDRKYYGGDRILYVGNYLNQDHKYFKLNEQELLKIFTPALKQINGKFKSSWVRKAWVFKAGFAQPIVTTNYSEQLPGIITPIPNLYWVSMEYVYPWDRGTNFSVAWGEKVAEMVLNR